MRNPSPGLPQSNPNNFNDIYEDPPQPPAGFLLFQQSNTNGTSVSTSSPSRSFNPSAVYFSAPFWSPMTAEQETTYYWNTFGQNTQCQIHRGASSNGVIAGMAGITPNSTSDVPSSYPNTGGYTTNVEFQPSTHVVEPYQVSLGGNEDEYQPAP